MTGRKRIANDSYRYGVCCVAEWVMLVNLARPYSGIDYEYKIGLGWEKNSHFTDGDGGYRTHSVQPKAFRRMVQKFDSDASLVW